MFWFGLSLFAVIIGMVAMGLGIFTDSDRWFHLGLALLVGWVLVLLVGIAVLFMVGIDPQDDPTEGACYMAVGDDVLVGKVWTREVELVRIECP